MNNAVTKLEIMQKEMVNSVLICQDMIEHQNSQYATLTKELSNAMWGWYNIKLEDTDHE